MTELPYVFESGIRYRDIQRLHYWLSLLSGIQVLPEFLAWCLEVQGGEVWRDRVRGVWFLEVSYPIHNCCLPLLIRESCCFFRCGQRVFHVG